MTGIVPCGEKHLEQLKYRYSVCGASETLCGEEGEAGGVLRPVDGARQSHPKVQQATDARDEEKLLPHFKNKSSSRR